MSFVDSFVEKVKGKSLSVVYPEGQDARVLSAARRVADENIARPIVLGKPEQIEAAATEAAVSLDGLTIVNPAEDDRIEAYTQAYCEGRDIKEGIARRMVKRPLYFAGSMVATGDADTFVAGVANPTAMVIQAGVLTVGLAEGIKTPSSFFLMIVPKFMDEADKAFVFADCAVNIAPTAEQLADIAIASVASGQNLLSEAPKAAMLSFSTKGSASHEDVDNVTSALEIVRSRNADLNVDGEFQADTAIVAKVAAKKLKEPSLVGGEANVLIFPDLNSGNIAYKLTQYLAGAAAIGPFLQGFAKPISDLSRGASVDDIVATTAICLAQV